MYAPFGGEHFVRSYCEDRQSRIVRYGLADSEFQLAKPELISTLRTDFLSYSRTEWVEQRMRIGSEVGIDKTKTQEVSRSGADRANA